jgi:hypothetical protein
MFLAIVCHTVESGKKAAMAVSSVAPPEMKNMSNPLRASNDSSLLFVSFVCIVLTINRLQIYKFALKKPNNLPLFRGKKSTVTPEPNPNSGNILTHKLTLSATQNSPTRDFILLRP